MEVKILDEDLLKIKEFQLEMLVELDRICRKNNIMYNLCAGTLLGAVRHKGFIPWDDDIDVRMIRSEYNKFCIACINDLNKDKFFLQNDKTDPNYRWGFARILRNGTQYVRVGQERLKQKNGIFIDIFPSDGLPIKPIEKKCYSILTLYCRKILWAPVGRRVIDNPLKKLGFYLLSSIPAKIPFILFNCLSKKYDERNAFRVGCMGLKGDKSIFGSQKIQQNGLLREWHTDLIELEFEGYKFFAPRDYHGWLVEAFGSDYMSLPPIEKRTVHHTVSSYSIG